MKPTSWRPAAAAALLLLAISGQMVASAHGMPHACGCDQGAYRATDDRADPIPSAGPTERQPERTRFIFEDAGV